MQSNIESLVKKHAGHHYDAEADIRAALTEQAETHAIELREYEATVANLNERIRQLEADKAEYDRRIVAVGGVAINSVSREYHDAEVTRLNALYESAVKGRQDFREACRRQLEADSLMADCMTQTRLDLIASGFMPESVAPMFVSDFVISKIRQLEAEQVPSPSCRECANRGRVNGLSQETYCDSCVWQGQSFRVNQYAAAPQPKESGHE